MATLSSSSGGSSAGVAADSERACQCRIERRAHALAVAADRRGGGPVRGRVGREPAPHGIDAEGEQAVEFRREGLQPGKPRAEQVPVEGLEVAEVEDEAVPLGNRPLVERIGPDQSEQPVGTDAGHRQACQQFMPGDGGVFFHGKHADPPGL